ncbi:MAG: PepSY domain-containing protein, partial [Steroidobacter sp.]
MSWKRALFLFHRWAGIVLCLFFALWFVSGIFMMYVEFPQLTRTERVAGARLLDFSTAKLTPADALERLQPQDFTRRATPSGFEQATIEAVIPRSIRLAMIAERPAYVIHADNGAQPRVVFADDGAVLRDVTERMGEEAVTAFVQRSGLGLGEAIAFRGSVQTDQWSVSGGLNDHRPLLRYALNDPKHTVLYVSSTTGEVVRDSDRTERVLNYFGAVTHWIYPTFIRQYPLLWEWIVDILSGVGVVLAITGLWIGVLRWNRRARPGKPQVPYKGLMRWHYFTGIVFGIVTVTWVFSGLLSMNPLNLNPPRRAEADQQLIYTGKALTAADFELPAQGFGRLAIEAELIHYAGQSFYRVLDRDGVTHMVAGNEQATALPDAATMMTLAPQLIPDAPLAEATLLTAYDNYYYARRPEQGERPLPVIRVRFADEQATWFHLNPLTGQILDRSTHTNRVYRWLYNGLHSFDIWWLWQRRPLWDICVIAFSLGG